MSKFTRVPGKVPNQRDFVISSRAVVEVKFSLAWRGANYCQTAHIWLHIHSVSQGLNRLELFSNALLSPVRLPSLHTSGKGEINVCRILLRSRMKDGLIV